MTWKIASGECAAASRRYEKKAADGKGPIPEFRSDGEAAEYFEKRSVAEVWEDLPELKPLKLSKKLEKEIRTRRTPVKSPISIRLDPEQIAAAQEIAAAKSVGYQTQLRMWIAEGIRREKRRAS